MEGGHSHVRKRQAPPRPCRFAPTILRLTEVFRYQTHQYPPFPQDHLCGFVSQYPFTTQSPYPDSVPKPKKQKPPRKVRASADARGERSKNSDRGEAFAPQKRECPSLWGDFQEPLSKKGFLKLLSFPGFLCRSKEIPKKEQSI